LYLGSTLTDESSCNQEIRARIGKAKAAFGKLEKILKSNGCGIKTKIRLYEAAVLSTLLYGSETWPMTVANGRKLNAAHNRWLRRILVYIYTALGGTRLQTRRYGKGWDRKIWET